MGQLEFVSDSENRWDILLADDDEDDVVIFETAIKELKLPYTLRHAKNGDDLFVQLENKVPDILFLDLHMPCKNGVTCITEIRANKQYDTLPIIVYTSSLLPKLIDECFERRANFYMQKAHTLLALTQQLNKIFSMDWDGALHYPERESFALS